MKKRCESVNKIFRTEKESFFPEENKYRDFRLPMSISLLVLEKTKKQQEPRNAASVGSCDREYISCRVKYSFGGGGIRYTEILKAGGGVGKIEGGER